MKTNKIIIILILLFVVVSCGKGASDEDIIRAAMKDAAVAAENKDVKGVLKHIAKDFRGDNGATYDDIKGILVGQMLSKEKISVTFANISVEVKGDTALVNANALLLGGQNQSLLPTSSEGLKMSLIFRKIGGEWKAASGSWQ